MILMNIIQITNKIEVFYFTQFSNYVYLVNNKKVINFKVSSIKLDLVKNNLNNIDTQKYIF